MNAIQDFDDLIDDGGTVRLDGAEDHLGGELGRRAATLAKLDGLVFPTHGRWLHAETLSMDRAMSIDSTALPGACQNDSGIWAFRPSGRSDRWGEESDDPIIPLPPRLRPIRQDKFAVRR